MRAAYHRIIADAELFHSTGGYSPTAGLPALRQLLVRFDEEIYGTPGLRSDNVIVGQSSTQLTYCLFTALLDRGDTVLLFDPAYANYRPQLAVLNDRIQAVSVPVLDTESWSYFDDGSAVVERVAQALAE